MKKILPNTDAHSRLILALIISGILFLATIGHIQQPAQAILVWNVFAWSLSLLAWARILLADAKSSVLTARLQDSARLAIFIFVLAAAVASLVSVAVLIGGAKGLGRGALAEHLFLAAGTVISSWFLVHTVFTLHYAHGFYSDGDGDGDQTTFGGLEFPNEKEPDFIDFAYFSFVIGMTCQVSDVQVTSQEMRCLALVHGLLSFLFNTVILALTINLASGLFGS
jgi:uncharacterized membrane protein